MERENCLANGVPCCEGNTIYVEKGKLCSEGSAIS